jgi:hypothetical protein
MSEEELPAMDAPANLPGDDRTKAKVCVRKSRVLARLTRLTWKKLLLPALKEFVLRSQAYQDKLKFMHDAAHQQPILQRIKSFFRDPEVMELIQEFIKLSGRRRKD